MEQRCEAELCPYWTGEGCACAVLGIEQGRVTNLITGPTSGTVIQAHTIRGEINLGRKTEQRNEGEQE